LNQAEFFRKIDSKDIFDYSAELSCLEDFYPIFPTIYDFRACIAVSYRMEVVSFVTLFTLLRFGHGKKKTGFLGYSLNQKFLVKVFIELAKGLNLETERF
jgi:hypothetical protein